MSFKAFRIHGGDAGHSAGIDRVTLDDLAEGEITINVAWSSVNYKDALAGSGKGKILRRYPMAGGIDVAGHVSASQDPRFQEGDRVLVTGCGLSETRDGGYSEQLRIPAAHSVKVPDGLDLRQAMGLGTAGFTAALSLYRMEQNGQRPDMGPILITGATGGVGSLAIQMFSGLGYDVHALTGKVERFHDLQEFGATQCISRSDLHWGQRPMESAKWAGALDNVGGETLSGLTRVIQPWGNIASCGLAGGIELHSTVMPFIIRGVSLLGIDSVNCPLAIREELWQRLAGDLRPERLDQLITREVTLEQLPEVFELMMAGDSFGRTVVKVG